MFPKMTYHTNKQRVSSMKCEAAKWRRWVSNKSRKPSGGGGGGGAGAGAGGYSGERD